MSVNNAAQKVASRENKNKKGRLRKNTRECIYIYGKNMQSKSCFYKIMFSFFKKNIERGFIILH